MKNGREGGARGIYASANMKSIAYYGNFLKLRVAERREQCEQKTANYWIVNRGPRYECPRKVDAEDEAIHPPWCRNDWQIIRVIVPRFIPEGCARQSGGT